VGSDEATEMTNPPTEVHFRITEKDAALAARLYGWPTRRIKWFIAVVLVLVPTALALVTWYVEPRLTPGLRWMRALAVGALSLVGGVLGGVGIPGLVQPWLARRNYRRHKLMQQPLALHVTEQGIHLQSPNGTSRLDWDQIFQWRQDRHNTLVYVAPNQYLVLPRRLAEQGLDMDELTALLTRHVGPVV